MKHPSKMTVTLSMVWIGAMGLLSNPKWLREFMDYVAKMTSGAAPARKSGPVASANPGGTRTGRVGGSI